MTKINSFINQQGATYNDNSGSIFAFSPEGTKIAQEIHVAQHEDKAQHKDKEEDNIEKAKAENADKQITNRQAVILVASLLNISLDPKYTNQDKLASFISRLTGKSAGSIRQTIMKDAKDGWETKQAREDMRTVAGILDSVCPELAAKLRRDAEEE